MSSGTYPATLRGAGTAIGLSRSVNGSRVAEHPSGTHARKAGRVVGACYIRPRCAGFVSTPHVCPRSSGDDVRRSQGPVMPGDDVRRSRGPVMPTGSESYGPTRWYDIYISTPRISASRPSTTL